ncbi:MAG: hypothetical protein JSV49_09745 [Thermoplasmata archaeon]|nr:MAG: hypothetical protein JSV49_09745 [Thermoplasmata archaeon]
MKKSNLIPIFLTISILINIWAMSYFYSLLDLESREVQEELEILEEKPLPQPEVLIRKPEIQSYELELGDFEYGTYVLKGNETIRNGNLSFFYERWDYGNESFNRIEVINQETNNTLVYFSDITTGNVMGIRGFKMEILSILKINITLKFSPYYESDYFGYGMFYLDSYDKSFSFEGNDTIIWKDFTYKNDSAIIKVYTDEESYMAWIPDDTQINLDFAGIFIKNPYCLTLRNCPCGKPLRDQNKILLG